MPAPNFVPAGWVYSVGFFEQVAALLFYGDGTIRLGHRCDRGVNGLIHCAPEVVLSPGHHEIVSIEPLTISPSLHCPDCGLHGFVESDVWIPA